MKRVEIEWEDSSAYEGWTKIEHVKSNKPARCITVGWLLSSNKECVVVASTRSMRKGGPCNGDMCIPRSAITSIKTLKRGEK